MKRAAVFILIGIASKEAIVRKTRGLLFLLILGVPAVLLHASPRVFQKAVVVSEQKHEPDVALHGKVTDAPDAPNEYDANVSIRLNCVVYLGRYKSAFHYLPSEFAPGQSVEVSPGKHYLYVKIPGTGEVKLRIMRRDPVTGESCEPGK